MLTHDFLLALDHTASHASRQGALDHLRAAEQELLLVRAAQGQAALAAECEGAFYGYVFRARELIYDAKETT